MRNGRRPNWLGNSIEHREEFADSPQSLFIECPSLAYEFCCFRDELVASKKLSGFRKVLLPLNEVASLAR